MGIGFWQANLKMVDDDIHDECKNYIAYATGVTTMGPTPTLEV